MKEKIVVGIWGIFCIITFLIVVGVQNQALTTGSITKYSIDHTGNGVIHFFVIGDFGTTKHTFDDTTSIQAVADLMNKVKGKNEHPLQFILTVGDNDYSRGAQGIFDNLVYDMMYNIYDGVNSIPWFLVLGNHDCREGYQAEIDLTRIYPAWNMPASYYNVTVPIDGDTSASFLFLNACSLTCTSWAPYPKWDDEECIDWNYKVTKNMWKEQYNWIERMLYLQNQDQSIVWKFVVFHNPLWSCGKVHGDNHSLKEYLFPILSEYNVTIIFTGHEHTQQHFTAVPFADLTM